MKKIAHGARQDLDHSDGAVLLEVEQRLYDVLSEVASSCDGEVLESRHCGRVQFLNGVLMIVKRRLLNIL